MGTMFVVLDIKYRFAWDEQKFCQIVEKFQNIMPKIVSYILYY